MRSIAAKVTSKGQITIPQQVRDRLRLRAGDHVLFKLPEGGDQDDDVAMHPERGRSRAGLTRIPDVVSLGGSMHPPKSAGGRTWEEVRASAWDAEVRRGR